MYHVIRSVDLKYQVEVSILANFAGSPNQKELLWLMLAIILIHGLLSRAWN
jgi:hypothetical protein